MLAGASQPHAARKPSLSEGKIRLQLVTKSSSGFDQGAVEEFHYVQDFLASLVNCSACA